MAGGSASAGRVLLINALAGVRFVVEDEHRRHPGGDRAVSGADLGVDRDQQGGKAAERHVRALAVLEPRDDRLIDPGQVLDLALGQARVHARGPDLAADQDQRVVRRAMVALSGTIDAKPLFQESLIHAAIQPHRAYPAINRCVTEAQSRGTGLDMPATGLDMPVTRIRRGALLSPICGREKGPASRSSRTSVPMARRARQRGTAGP
jgi:hypothetical protein